MIYKGLIVLGSPIFAHFSETLNGVSTLRAFGKQQQCIQQNAARIDDSNRAYYYLQVCLTVTLCNNIHLIVVLLYCSDTVRHAGVCHTGAL